MRLLHTADWHLGNAMHNVDREKEQESFLKWLTEVVREKNIDTLVVAGDIFDAYGPPNWAQKNYYRFLASLLGTNCHNVIVVGGNHDSGKLLDAPRDLFDALNIHVVGTIANRRIEEMVFELKDEKGNAAAVCAAVPYVPEILLQNYCEDRKSCPQGQFSDIVYQGLYQDFLGKAKKLRGARDIPLIATGHLYAAGLEGRYEGMEGEEKTDDGVRVMDVVGNLGKVHVNAFPDEFDYVALGHIHYQTRIGKVDRIRYSGSPFVMGFDEANLDHYVLQADLGDAKDPHALRVEKIKVPQSVCFRRLSGTKDEIAGQLKQVMQAASEADGCGKYCLELHYPAQEAVALREMVEKLEFPENVSVVSWKVKNTENGYRAELGAHDLRSMSNIDPEDIVRELVLSKISIDRENLTEEEYAEKQEETVKKYLPYFMEALNAAHRTGGKNEDTEAYF